MSKINQNDLRRYRMRSTGIVYRVIGERSDEMDFAPVCGGVALEIKRSVIDETFARCDLIDTKSPTCEGCGGEKFTLYGGVTVCVYCASRQPVSTSSESDAASDAERFVRHLEAASDAVRGCPAWKREVAEKVFGGPTDTASSDYASRLIPRDGYAAAERAIDALGELRDGWADVDSIAPSSESIAAAKILARAMLGFGCEFDVDGDVNGGVSLTMFGHRRNAWFVVASDGLVSMVLTDGTKNAPRSPRVDTLDPAKSIIEAMEWVGHLLSS
mgnify:CR=1 FL=1